MSWFEQRRATVENDLIQLGRWKYYSPIVYTQYTVTLPMILRHVNGDLLDVGCGRMPYKKEIIEFVDHYDGLDIDPGMDDVRFKSDAQDMYEIDDKSYDSAICLEVLEHVQDPLRVLIEINRILKPGGKLILSVPHLSRLHDIPNDYFRYTRFGIEYLLRKAGFLPKETREKGGLLVFLGHQLSTVLLSIFVNIPILKYFIYFVNEIFITRLCCWIDRCVDTKGIFACGYAVVAQKE